MRLKVDWILCDGYGLCGDLVPDLIELDDWRYPIVTSEVLDGERLNEAQRAVDCCPMKALRLERGHEISRRSAPSRQQPERRWSAARPPRPGLLPPRRSA